MTPPSWGLLARLPDREHRCGTSISRSAWRIGASLVRRRVPALSVPVVDIEGAFVRADLHTPLGLALYRYGHCSPESRLLRQLLRPGDVFVDGGANVGLLSLLGALAVGSSGRVLACEPGPGTMAILKANADENGFAALECHQVALSDQTGIAVFVVFEDGSGLASFAPEAGGGTTVRVPVTTLDELTSAYSNRVAVVKLDVEGAEAKALRGASRLIARSAPLFIVEVEPEHLARQGSSIDDVQEALAPHGYVAYALTHAAHVTRLVGTWRPPDPRCPNLLLASPARIDRLTHSQQMVCS